MRVIAGRFRSRKLKSVPGLDTRPTPDRLRESLFNVLAPSIEGAIFVDAYAGTGSVGIEALSRGAERAVFIERSRGAIAVLRENLASLGVTGSANRRSTLSVPMTSLPSLMGTQMNETSSLDKFRARVRFRKRGSSETRGMTIGLPVSTTRPVTPSPFLYFPRSS